MEAHHLLWWLLVGLIAGAVAAKVVRGRGYGLIANTVVGLAGAFIGGFIFSRLQPVVIVDGTIDQIIVAFIGAVILLVVLRLIAPHGLRH